MRGILLVAVLSAGVACSGGGSPVAPPPATVQLSGVVTATNGGQPLGGATIDAAGQQTITDSAGAFSLNTSTGRVLLMVSGAGILPRVHAVNAGPVSLDAITLSNGFDLGFYRQFVRNGYEQPTKLEPLRRWTTAPSFDIQATDDTGTPVDPALRASVQAAIAAVTPLLTGGQFNASFGSGVPVRFVRDLHGLCGRAGIGPTNAYIELQLVCGPLFPRTAAHETGHVLGFWHTDNPTDLMYVGGGNHPSAREQYHAAIAYRRPPGNRDPDSDE